MAKRNDIDTVIVFDNYSIKQKSHAQGSYSITYTLLVLI